MKCGDKVGADAATTAEYEVMRCCGGMFVPVSCVCCSAWTGSGRVTPFWRPCDQRPQRGGTEKGTRASGRSGQAGNFSMSCPVDVRLHVVMCRVPCVVMSSGWAGSG